ncbi:Cell division protein FtsX [hydrothermal vent metagenome]|uniref:Cell division protein FtsX n=1 Tax=hydrothermal vent metagenome TaxID=652676 RepID=A0A3B0VSI8_9ZZZZ
MKLTKIIGVAAHSILKHKTRTFLIELAIMVGIATLTVIVALTEGANQQIMKRIQNFGPNAIMVHSGGGKMRGPSTAAEANLTRKDISDIENINGVKFTTPIQVELDMPLKHGNKFSTAWVMGVKPNWQDAWRRGAARGEFISAADNEQLSKVCLIGTTTAADLFGKADPVGASIMVNNVSFKVIGILEKRGQSPAGTDFDNLVIMPFSTASRRLMNQPRYTSMLRVIIADPAQAKQIAGRIRETLRENHHLAPTEEDDFRISTAEHVAKMIRSSSKTLGLFLGLIAVIAPIVGGIVLMNIMLMAVSERKREIGLRRAMGARKGHIVLQFLSESVILTFAGGILGVGAGVIIAFGIRHLGKPISITWQPFAIAFVFCILIGLLFGVYPAQKAANLDPVQALNQ